jgi:hypothetical protein
MADLIVLSFKDKRSPSQGRHSTLITLVVERYAGG